MTEPSNNYILENFKLKDTNIIVIVDGVYKPDLSDSDPNTVFTGNILKILKNTKNIPPLHLLFLASQNHQKRFNMVIEKNSYINIIEEHASLKDQVYTSEIEINITAQSESRVFYQKIRLANPNNSSYQVRTFIKQEKNSKFESSLISKGTRSSQEFAHIKLSEEGALYENKSLSLLSDHQTLNNQMRIEHLKPNCTSNVLAKNIVDDKATSSFDCRVIAHPKAVKTETHVNNKNLLLSEKATANSAPELEIYVDDIICTHGATVGQFDEDAMFYIRSRGIKKDQARKILTAAFAQEITEQILKKYERLKMATGLTHE